MGKAKADRSSPESLGQARGHSFTHSFIQQLFVKHPSPAMDTAVDREQRQDTLKTLGHSSQPIVKCSVKAANLDGQ